MTNTKGDPITVADPDGGNPREIYRGEHADHNHAPVWSTDGEWIYFIHGNPDADRMSIWRIRPTGDAPPPEPLTGREFVTSLAPLDPRTVLYTARDSVGAGPWLWTLDTETRTSHRVSLGPEQYTSIAASADGRRLVASIAKPRAELLTVPIMARLATVDDVQPYGVPGVRALAPRIRGQALFYLSGQGTGDGLWRLQDKQATRSGAVFGALLEPASVSPDGLRSRSCCTGGNGPDAQRPTVPAAGDRRVHRCCGTSDWCRMMWWSAAASTEAGRGLFQDSRGRRRTGPLTKEEAFDPVWSPAEDLTVTPARWAVKPRAGGSPDGRPVERPPANVRLHHHWTAPISAPNGRGVVFLKGGRGVNGLLAAGSDQQEDASRNYLATSQGDWAFRHPLRQADHLRSVGTLDIVLIDLPQRQ
jgi:hypothetical protein